MILRDAVSAATPTEECDLPPGGAAHQHFNLAAWPTATPLGRALRDDLCEVWKSSTSKRSQREASGLQPLVLSFLHKLVGLEVVAATIFLMEFVICFVLILLLRLMLHFKDPGSGEVVFLLRLRQVAETLAFIAFFASQQLINQNIFKKKIFLQVL